ncbi:Hypothetical protein PAU_00028 [Photorhabdus asymbiotica]|uniref:Uncharacterized protein n=1 Tax=Photorhabdus asymbiotica subsp. asymbiotica (strain ATCC 43949 / 3105-77) TaxID=553480 RepID=C7BTY6_PHOAA|nr:Hypothetical protein PAU_00028 [Photorhabdus asymbiotica]
MLNSYLPKDSDIAIYHSAKLACQEYTSNYLGRIVYSIRVLEQ